MTEISTYTPEVFVGKHYNNESGGNKLITVLTTQRMLKNSVVIQILRIFKSSIK